VSKLEFKDLTLDDIPKLRPWFCNPPSRLCDFTIGGTWMWRDLFTYSYAIVDEWLFLRMVIFEDLVAYSLPLGPNREAGIDYLIEHTKASGESLVFSIVGKGDLPLIESVFPAAFIRPERDYFDYLYETQDLLDLVGRPHKSTRNHISKFLRMYQDYAFERIDESNLAEARTFIETYLKNVVLEKDYPSLLEERIKVLEVLDNLELYGMFGGVLTVSGEIVGLSLGEFCGDTLFVHTEKALTDFAGAYQMLMHEFLKSFATDPDIVYVNREDDSGDEGLRRSKMSYNPIRLIEKYTVFTEGEPAGDEKDCV